jgi:formylglycine-generating enzyme required for sulfatase activity
VSPYGVRDLAGNLQEWTASKDARGLPVLRGGNWDETASSELVEFMAVAHSRQAGLLAYSIGARCAAAPLPGQRVGDQRP